MSVVSALRTKRQVAAEFQDSQRDTVTFSKKKNKKKKEQSSEVKAINHPSVEAAGSQLKHGLHPTGTV